MGPECRALRDRCRPTPRVGTGQEVIAGSGVEGVEVAVAGPRDAKLVELQYQWSTMMVPACCLAVIAAADMGDGFGHNW